MWLTAVTCHLAPVISHMCKDIRFGPYVQINKLKNSALVKPNAIMKPDILHDFPDGCVVPFAAYVAASIHPYALL